MALPWNEGVQVGCIVQHVDRSGGGPSRACCQASSAGRAGAWVPSQRRLFHTL